MWESFPQDGRRCVKTFNGILIALAEEGRQLRCTYDPIRSDPYQVDPSQPALNFLSRVGYAI